jgi:hypothetical protein
MVYSQLERWLAGVVLFCWRSLASLLIIRKYGDRGSDARRRFFFAQRLVICRFYFL